MLDLGLDAAKSVENVQTLSVAGVGSPYLRFPLSCSSEVRVMLTFAGQHAASRCLKSINSSADSTWLMLDTLVVEDNSGLVSDAPSASKPHLIKPGPRPDAIS